MSGGSFDYLCFKEADDYVAFPPESMDAMARALSFYDTPESHAAAQATSRFIARLNAMRDTIEGELKLLRPVWKAVEWHHSCDWSKDQVLEELEAFVMGTKK